MATAGSTERLSFIQRMMVRLFHIWFLLSRGMTLGVRAACFDAEGRVFLVRHTYVPGWQFPGGGVERMETVRGALAKELREEGNLTIIGEPELLAVYFNSRHSRRDHVAFYRCTVTQDAPRLPDREIAECGFFARDALPEGTTPATLRRLAELSGTSPVAEHW